MFKILTVGDVHVVPHELEDSLALINYIEKISEENEVDQILFTGDIYHTHSVIRMEVLHFWHEAFNRLKNVIVTVGNHDLISEQGDPKKHALLAHDRQIHVIDEPWSDSGILYMPYRSDKQLFIDECKSAANKTNTIFSHQSFDGVEFDNGWYDPLGIDLLFIKQQNLICGHIHKPQQFSKVQYVGAPRWRSLSDANTNRAIWLFEFDDKGHIIKKTPFSTNDVCRQIKYVKDTEIEPFDVNLYDPKHSWRVDIEGNAAYLEKRKKELQRPGLKIHCIKTDKVRGPVRESDGIKVAFEKFTHNYIPKFGTSTDKLFKLAKERLELE